ncbi:MAG: hypothetical protein WAV40_00285 [Microgenomates group bacterium]
MPIWKQPPIIKVYEALGCVADKRIHVEGDSAKVYSSSGNKFYTVTYDPKANAIVCNDNGSYWTGYLGYPAIAFLLQIGVIPYSLELANLLKDIMWKDINQSFKNDFAKTEKYCKNLVVERHGNLPLLLEDIENIYQYLSYHPLSILGDKVKPPSGY